jgi:hypothetical protein
LFRFRGGRASRRRNQLADVHIARRDHPVERRLDTLKRLQLLQPVHVRLGGIDLGHARSQLRGRVVRVLLRDRVLSDQSLVTIGSHLCNGGIALRGGQIRLRLSKLLVQLGRFDDRQQFALVYVRTDVVIPNLHIACGASVDRRKSEGLDIAWQHDLPRTLFKHRLGKQDRRSGHLVGVVDQFGIGTLPIDDAEDGNDGRHQQDNNDQRQQGSARNIRWRMISFRGPVACLLRRSRLAVTCLRQVRLPCIHSCISVRIFGAGSACLVHSIMLGLIPIRWLSRGRAGHIAVHQGEEGRHKRQRAKGRQ